MKRWAIGFFLCYPLLPVAFVCGLGLVEHRPFAIFAVLYYALLLACTWNLRRLGGWAGRWYLLAFAVTCLHLSGVGGMMLDGGTNEGPWGGSDAFFGVVLFTIFGVYVAATWAASALAFRQERTLEGVLQLLAPIALVLGMGTHLGVPIVLLAFGGQAVDALILSLKLVTHAENEDSHIGLSPSEKSSALS